ncbi:MAG: aminomethyl-transferring glycine dehydrogenase subunit GcvPA [Tannerella sp.]|jgi:glycine dehydrogenase subunit 1|nr:aminomethyl-transferring glycine dehydrogenase subunit GcvPA [Tannerella sp.]
MAKYVPVNSSERAEMLEAIGLRTVDELFSQIPDKIKLRSLNLPSGMSELEVSRHIQGLVDKNIRFGTIFRGAGAYNHYIPSIVRSITGKEEFMTAYTPYQAEISQGVLQSIFEFQTMICRLTGMDTSNASVYDGASAAAESVAMCVERKRTKMLVAANANQMVISTMMTYCAGSGAEIVLVPTVDDKSDPEYGLVDIGALKTLLDDTTAGFYLQQPNYYGLIEDATVLGEAVHAAGAKFVIGVNPISLGLLKTPAEHGADIAVGEGQPLGMPLSFGGPYLGFMASTTALQRKLPGRIVGETVDVDGRRAFVLTLQAREQHIRREKASSNICSNQALCAMTAAVYMAAMGPDGLHEVARQNYSKSHYAASKIAVVPGFSLRYKSDFFNEFVTDCPDPSAVLTSLENKGILGGYPVDGGILWCVTEMNTKAEIDELVKTILDR